MKCQLPRADFAQAVTEHPDILPKPLKQTMTNKILSKEMPNFGIVKIQILAELNDCYLVSKINNFTAADRWYTVDELENEG